MNNLSLDSMGFVLPNNTTWFDLFQKVTPRIRSSPFVIFLHFPDAGVISLNELKNRVRMEQKMTMTEFNRHFYKKFKINEVCLKS